MKSNHIQSNDWNEILNTYNISKIRENYMNEVSRYQVLSTSTKLVTNSQNILLYNNKLNKKNNNNSNERQHKDNQQHNTKHNTTQQHNNKKKNRPPIFCGW